MASRPPRRALWPDIARSGACQRPSYPEPSGLAGSANAFAMAAGGGVDVELAHHWSVRLVQVDYYLTRFDNAGNDHQNNVPVGIGTAFRFGPRS